MSIRVASLVFADLAFATLVMAQQPVLVPALDSDARVRVTYSEGGKSRTVTGTLTFQDVNAMTIVDRPEATVAAIPSAGGPPSHPQHLRGHQVSIAQADISSLEMSGGRHSSAALGALVGGGIGLAGGITLGVHYQCSNSSDYFACTDGVAQIGALALVTAASGAGIGAIVGALFHHESWRPVSREPSITPIIGRRGHGVVAGVSLRF